MADERGLQAARPFRFACQRCGHCCSGGSGYVWVDESEIEPMARSLGMSQDNFTARYLKRALDPRRGVEAWSLRERADAGGACALLVGRNTCLVYEARPRHCREFPYWEHVLAGGEGFEAARETCPGIAVVVPPEQAAPAFAALQQAVESLCARHAHCQVNRTSAACRASWPMSVGAAAWKRIVLLQLGWQVRAAGWVLRVRSPVCWLR